MLDKRMQDVEEISRIKRTQVVMWLLFFVIILIGLILVFNEMQKISIASEEITKINGTVVTNKYGEVIKEYKAPRFKVDENGNSIDLLKYWKKKWNTHTFWALLISFIAIILLILIIKEIRFLNRLEIEKIFKYELDKSED